MSIPANPNPTAPCSPQSPTPQLREVLERIGTGKTDGVDELRGLLERFPAAPDVIGNLAWALAHRNEHEEAIALYRRYLELAPESIEVRWRIADRLVNLGRLEEARRTYQAVLDAHPESEDARVGVRYVEYLLGRDNRESTRSGQRCPDPTPLQRENQETNPREFAEERLRLRSLPPRLFLESTTKCNFHCQTCTKGHGPYYAEDLLPEILERVRREVMPTNLSLSITGFGEPTLAGNFDAILDMAFRNGSKVLFVTNGSLLHFRRLEQLCRQPVAITLSVDGATAATFESIRSGGRFERLLEKLAMIRKLRDIYLSSVSSHFSFNFVALRNNLHELPDVVRLAHRYGIDVVGVADYALNTTEFDENSPRYAPEESNRRLEEARRVAEALGVKLDLPPPYDPTPPPPPRSDFRTKLRSARRLWPAPNRFPRKCSSPWSEPYIHTDGRVVPCCASEQYLGDLKKNAFAAIWNGWRYRLLRLRIHSPLPPQGCRHCFVSWGINGGNAGNVMAKEGLVIKAFYVFEMAARRAVRRSLDFFGSLARRRDPNAPPPGGQPNYYRGRPLSETNRPEAPARKKNTA